MKESVECLISTIKTNPMLLARVSESFKLAKQASHKDNEIFESGPLSIMSATAPSKRGRGSLSVPIGLPTALPRMPMSTNEDFSKSNILGYFFVLMRDAFESKQGRQLHYLSFLRAICKYQSRGITANQEAIFRVMNTHRDLQSRVLINLVSDNTGLVVEAKGGKTVPFHDYLK